MYRQQAFHLKQLIFLGKESSASPLPKRTQSNVTSSDIVTRNIGMKVIYNMVKYVLNINAKLNSWLYTEVADVHFQDQPGTRHLSSFSSLDNPRARQIQKAPVRTKSMLAAFFVRHRSGKMKNVSVRWSAADLQFAMASCTMKYTQETQSTSLIWYSLRALI
jgi:hypothetical protein